MIEGVPKRLGEADPAAALWLAALLRVRRPATVPEEDLALRPLVC